MLVIGEDIRDSSDTQEDWKIGATKLREGSTHVMSKAATQNENQTSQASTPKNDGNVQKRPCTELEYIINEVL